jgi:hypothetical protein
VTNWLDGGSRLEASMAAEWDRFKFEIGRANSEELTTVRHVVHAAPARRIVEDKLIKAGLIHDKSKLNTSRISVAWVSANTWGLGSIYGTIEFQFTWSDLVKDQKIYWVETMTQYNPHAYRLLLSKRDITSPLVTRYDPAKDEGPLRLKDNKYYWRNNYTSEFMIEEDLHLDRCTGVDFVTHNSVYCSAYGDACPDRQNPPTIQRTGGRMMSFVLGNGHHVLDKHLKPAGKSPSLLDVGYRGLEVFLPAQVNFTNTVTADAACQDVVRGALALFGNQQVDAAKKLLGLISRDNYIKALKAIVRAHFSDPKWEPGDAF